MTPTYIGIEGAKELLAGMGIHLTSRQIKRAADPDAHGRRKLPFFVDPIDKRLKIAKLFRGFAQQALRRRLFYG